MIALCDVKVLKCPIPNRPCWNSSSMDGISLTHMPSGIECFSINPNLTRNQNLEAAMIELEKQVSIYNLLQLANDHRQAESKLSFSISGERISTMTPVQPNQKESLLDDVMLLIDKLAPPGVYIPIDISRELVRIRKRYSEVNYQKDFPINCPVMVNNGQFGQVDSYNVQQGSTVVLIVVKQTNGIKTGYTSNRLTRLYPEGKM